MILRPKPAPRHHAMLAGAPSTAPMATVPAWLRRAIPDAQSLAGKDVEDVTIAAGATVGARCGRPPAGAMGRRLAARLALSAAAATASRAGRTEDEGAMRDAVLLTRPGDDVGPGGRMLLAWRRLALRPTDDLFTAAGLAAVLDEHGRAPDDGTTSELVDDLRRLAAAGSFVTVLTGAFATWLLARGCAARPQVGLVARRAAARCPASG